MKFNIVVLPGDGIGPEIIDESVKVMNAVGKKFGHEFNCEYALIGGVAIDEEGTALSQETIDKCKKSDAVLLGAVGDPRFDDPQAPVHPEEGLLAIRKELGLFANLRPVCSYPSLLDHTISNLRY